MQAHGREAVGGVGYERHRPEETRLYQLIEQHYPALVVHLAEQGKVLPDYVQQEFAAYLKCGRLEHGFLRVRCESCHLERLVAFSCKRRGFCPSCGARRMTETAALLADEVFPTVPLRQWVISFPFALRFLFAAHPQAMGKVLGIVYRTIASHVIRKAGFTLSEAATGAVTLIQRFGSALNLNIHCHVLFLDGVYLPRNNGTLAFHRVKAPDHAELLGSSVSYRIAVGPQQGRKAFMLRTLTPLAEPDPANERVAKVAGFSLHAGVSCEAHQRDKRERLCRYIARPALSEKRLSLSAHGKVVYTLKTPYRDGTTQVVFEPLDFIARLAALVPRPRVNLTRYHGVLAPNHRWRALVTPAGRGKGAKSTLRGEEKSPPERHAAMAWAQRLKRVFNIDIDTCVRCGGPVKVLACIEEQSVIDQILAHLRDKQHKAPAPPLLVPPPRAPPHSLFLPG